MKIVTYNIQFGRGKDSIYDLERIAEELKGADIIALQEVETYIGRSGNTNQPQILADLLDEYFWVYGPGVDIAARNNGDKNIPRNARRQFGNMLLSRTEILSSRNHLLPKYGSTGPLSIQRSALEGVIQTNAGPVRFYSIHLCHLAGYIREKQIKRILEIDRIAPFEGAAISGKDYGDCWFDNLHPPHLNTQSVLLGDFNLTYDSPEYELLVGPYSTYGGRITNPDGFVDSWVYCGNEENAGITAQPRDEQFRMDYCFIKTCLAKHIKSTFIDSAALGSDHQPVWVEIEI